MFGGSNTYSPGVWMSRAKTTWFFSVTSFWMFHSWPFEKGDFLWPPFGYDEVELLEISKGRTHEVSRTLKKPEYQIALASNLLT